MRAEHARMYERSGEARLLDALEEAVGEIIDVAVACERAARSYPEPEPINTGKAAAYRIAAGRVNRILHTRGQP